ncbi:transporter [Stenotrophomonas sp. SAU14A_NAIMI4_5]|uniref:transporter n=1 Tax=Stenotrophomonas sp. SAU14A_NAIMI4_5 TaxID=2072413 RepID=UPI000D53FDAD|nr:transporter [Stenotrophomonas sp. SAU14A_NAIMI4_5]AWH50191.1 transporter [Stenotrophomonas sp. SAU14A_NAIMI4_5]
MRLASVAVLLVAAVGSARADDSSVPGFDRPGLGFSTDTVKPRKVALEFGFPTYERTHDASGTSREVTSSALLRTGLTEAMELQVQASPWTRRRITAAGVAATTDEGIGDTTVSLKWAGPGSSETTSWALRASAVVDTGRSSFSDGRQYALAASVEHQLSDRWTGAFYASHQRGAGSHSSTWSPSVSFEATERLGIFIEAGFTATSDEPHEAVAGAGVTWAFTPRIQLDASFDAGLDEKSPDLQAGLGVSIFLE